MQQDRTKENKERIEDVYELSKDELVQKNILDSKEANEIIENKKQNNRKPTKIGTFGYLSKKLDKLKEIYHYKKSYGRIKSVEVDDNVKLYIEYNSHTVPIEIDSDSATIPNLLEYYNVNNLQGLQNRNIFVQYIHFENRNRISTILPHNVSFIGSLRYKLYSNLLNITGLLYSNKGFYSIEMIFASIMVLPMLLMLATESIFVLILAIPFIVMSSFVIIAILLMIISLILHTDNFKQYSNKCEN